jgi:hypothetical protein
MAPSAGEAAIALDGKTLRGSRKQGAPGVHLLSALSHHLGLTLAQQGVDDKTNEITQVETVLHQLVLQGRVCTMDALLTQRQVASGRNTARATVGREFPSCTLSVCAAGS